jgi:hypothetical protein
VGVAALRRGYFDMVRAARGDGRGGKVSRGGGRCACVHDGQLRDPLPSGQASECLAQSDQGSPRPK